MYLSKLNLTDKRWKKAPNFEQILGNIDFVIENSPLSLRQKVEAAQRAPHQSE